MNKYIIFNLFICIFLMNCIVAKECVVLLHGLGRTPHSMSKLARFLEKEEYNVINAGYPSKKYQINKLVDHYVHAAVEKCKNDDSIHFVTHSLGGILVRSYLSKYKLKNLGHVIMIAPPNNGSELVDKLGKIFLFKWYLGPAFLQLSTNKDSFLNSLPIPDYSVGVIAGSRSLNPFFSLMISR